MSIEGLLYSLVSIDQSKRCSVHASICLVLMQGKPGEATVEAGCHSLLQRVLDSLVAWYIHESKVAGTVTHPEVASWFSGYPRERCHMWCELMFQQHLALLQTLARSC